MANEYSVLSKFYDTIIYDEEYQKWVDYELSIVKAHAKGDSGCDVACGSGIFTRALKRAGFKVIGVDISKEMIENAINLNSKENLSITYINQNMKNLKLFEKVWFITSFNDGLNYVNGEDFIKCLKSFNKCLREGGLLVFDISSKYKLENVLGNNMYGDNSEKLSYIWFNTLKEDSVEINVTFFEKQGDKYIRYDENQVEYVHSLDFVKESLEKCGFTLLSVTGELGEPLTSQSTRQIFTAIKK